MKKFVVERTIPGAGSMSPEELQSFSYYACHIIDLLDKPYYWVQSYVTEDKIYCIHIAASEEEVREHARLSNFPVHAIAEVKTIIDPVTGNK